MAKDGRLVLGARTDEIFVLFDTVSRITTRIRVFCRKNGSLAVVFEAPEQVNISREKQRNMFSGD